MKDPVSSIALPMKVVYLVIAVLLLMLGLVGLVLPIIPGVLFLAGAILVLGKVSSRVRNWSRGHRGFRSMRLRMARVGGIGLVDRMKLMGWMSLEMLFKGITGVGRLARQSVGKFRA